MQDEKENRRNWWKGELIQGALAMWIIRCQDSLPTGPQNTKYQTKWSTQHNWYAPYRHDGPPPNAYIP